MSSFPPVQSVTRALQILTEVNKLGVATVGALHKKTGIPKPTIVRLLQTMAHDGYVSQDHRMRGYQITSLASALSAGFHNMPLILELARHWAIDLTQRVKWPVGVCTPDGDVVVVRYSTAADSPVSPFQSTIGMRHALAKRALGRAYLAFCPDDEQKMLLRMIASSKEPENRTSSADELLRMIATTRSRGYAVRDKLAEPRSSRTVAVPLRRADGRVMATFGLTYFRSAVPTSAFDNLVKAVQDAGSNIERELAAK